MEGIKFIYLKFWCKQCKKYHVIVSQLEEVEYTTQLINSIFEDKEYKTNGIEILLKKDLVSTKF